MLPNLLLSVIVTTLLWNFPSAATAGLTKPNFVFIITDDQDLHLESLAYQPSVRKRMGEEGTFFSKHYCTIALCCPSRVSLLTGKLAHNTNVTDIAPPYGGYPKFITQGLNDNYLPVWLQDAGYNTYYTGKLMNAHSIATYNKPFPKGWNGTGFLIDPGTYTYYNTIWQAGFDPPVSRPGEYSTDIVAGTALEFIDEAYKAKGPFFIGVAPIAPHSQAQVIPGTFLAYLQAPVPAIRHQNLFPDVKIPREQNFNPDMPSGASWISSLPQLNDTEIDYIDSFYRARLQALQAVDELVDVITDRLEQYNLIENTYIIYTSDNGFHMGQHRMQPGKSCAFEEDVNVPFFIRGPGIPKNRTVEFMTSHTDITPTIFRLAGMQLRDDFDGTPMPVTGWSMDMAKSSPLHDHVAIEYWGDAIGEGAFASTGLNGSYTLWPNNTYKAMRIVSDEYSLFYSVWCTNQKELYDMTIDPYQMNNFFSISSTGTVLGYPLTQVTARLDAVLMVLKSCRGQQCTMPWTILHPDGKVCNLQDALKPQYDSFYATQAKVSFSSCELGYILAAEGPQEVQVYEAMKYHLGD